MTSECVDHYAIQAYTSSSLGYSMVSLTMDVGVARYVTFAVIGCDRLGFSHKSLQLIMEEIVNHFP